MLAAARCDEGLSLRDLVKPERARVLRVLSALINLQKFKVEKLVWYSEQEEKKVRAIHAPRAPLPRARAAAHARALAPPLPPPQLEVLRRKEAIEAQHEDTKRRIEAERSLRDAEQPAIAAANAQRRDLEATRNERSAALEELRTGTKSMKEELLASRDEVQAQQVRIGEARASVDAARALVISSPEKVKAEVAALEAASEAEQAALDAAEAHRRLLGRQLEVVAKADKDVTKAMTLMSEAEVRAGGGALVTAGGGRWARGACALCARPHSLSPPLSQAEAVKLKRIQKDEKARKGELEAVAAEVEALKAQLEHANAQRRRVEEKLHDVRASAEARLAAQAKELEAVWREAAEYGDDLKASVDSRRAAEAEEMRLERRKEALISQHSGEVADMVGSLKRLSVSLAAYNGGIVKGLAALADGGRQGL